MVYKVNNTQNVNFKTIIMMTRYDIKQIDKIIYLTIENYFMRVLNKDLRQKPTILVGID